MFDGLTERLGGIFDRLTKRGALSEADITEAMREVRVALLEADVALPVVKDFVERVSNRARGQDVVKSVTPGQMVVKIVHDELVADLGATSEGLQLNARPPVAVMMAGLQGSGKTTTTAKLAKYLTDREKKKVLMASLDVRRPAAQEQLQVLGDQALIATLDIVFGEPPVDIACRAVDRAAREGYDVVLLDTAGRLAIDDALMQEAVAIRDATEPAEILLVADAMTGQDAVNTARIFNEKIGLTGIVLTRVDGDARGGAALSMRAVTGCPIKMLGTGEQLDALEAFHPDRIAGRILGLGDVVSLVEKAQETVEADQAAKFAEKFQKGQFDLDDMADQLKQLKKMGGLGGLMNLMPGVGKVKKALDQQNIDEGMLVRQAAMLSSMTTQERKRPAIIKASRKKRIAAGSGTTVQEINKLLKQFQSMQTMMKRMRKQAGKGGLPPLGGLGGGLPPGALPPGLPPIGSS
ncbi:MAG: signal recognition particle protein [Alphaproteobacteria bacterium]|nr:signal recognition particle protein [Alphaproteobacteria bacterium]